ncbi:Uncharacterised protein [uncultured archaeon]|nr:Uncharacterised protein [uncultured archaeon]
MTIPSDPHGVHTSAKKSAEIKEPSLIIRPIGRFGGLDGLHVTLAIVAVLLLALLLVVSYSGPIVITNSTIASNCTYVHLNGTCAKPVHNATEVGMMVRRVLASYSGVNSSLSLLPFFSNVSSINSTYLPESKAWYSSLKVRNPAGNSTFQMSFLVSDSNLSSITPLIQTQVPSVISNNYVATQGAVLLSGKVSCGSAATSVYWFIDPYATGSVRSLLNATRLESKFKSAINLTVNIINGPRTQAMSGQYGLDNATLLGRYVFCASKQSNFTSFVSNLDSLYSGAYMPGPVLSNVANVSRLNYTALQSCIATSTEKINNQALLASYYNITLTPLVVVDCNYLALPQTASSALCYVNGSLC